jgi:hypothetical protein
MERKDNTDNLEPRDVREEHVSLADMRSTRKISHRSRYAGKTFLELRMEEFERSSSGRERGIARA